MPRIHRIATPARAALAVLVALAVFLAAADGIAAAAPPLAPPGSGAPGTMAAPPPAAVVVDAGDDAAPWTAQHSPSATARIVAGRGEVGLAFDLGRGRGYATARRAVDVDLPADWRLVLRVRGDARANVLEVKLVSGGDVWWRRIPAFAPGAAPRDVRVARQAVSFAWGPSGGAPLTHVDALEVAVVPGDGGQGTIWIDEIRLEPLDPDEARRPPSASSPSDPAGADLAVDGDPSTAWATAPGPRRAELVLDFHRAVEHGGLRVDHAPGAAASRWTVEASLDGRAWQEARRVERGNGGRDWIWLPDTFARYLRLRFEVPAGARAMVAEAAPLAADVGTSANAFFTVVARDAAPGTFPRYFSGEQSWWTVAGVPRDSHEALVGEEGAVEVDAGAFSLEPFLWTDGKLASWRDSSPVVALEDGDLPIPTVARRHGDHRLAVTAVAAGREGSATLLVRYRVTAGPAGLDGRLFVAARPFQVLPPWQALNRTGGTTGMERIDGGPAGAVVDGRRLVPIGGADGFGAAAFDEGDITAFLAAGDVPPRRAVRDAFAYASAAFAWELRLGPGEVRDAWIAHPWQAGAPLPVDADEAEAVLALVRSSWRRKVDRAGLVLPAAAEGWADSVRANLAYILVHADGPAIHPGSRAYERSWIRDGAMTSQALLELGFDDEVKAFLRWFARYVGDDGNVPCCVDALGADPVPEHDSFGEFVWAVAEAWRFTRDEALVRELWPAVRRAADRMTALRRRRMTAPFLEEGRRPFYGLLPESISHEGYSAKPVHSYWDQAFALRGYADAAMLAAVVGDAAAAGGLEAERAAFAADLGASVRATMRAHRLDVAPASVELGDFDPTSTAVAFVLGAEGVYPRAALERSFARYMDDFRLRRARTPAAGVGYTAYELRNATALLLLGRRAEAVEVLDALVADQRPRGWRQWPEISWLRDDEGAFIGDVPHTWIGSTFVHAARTAVVAERDDATAPASPAWLEVGAGIPLAWLRGGGEAGGRALPTWFGPLAVSIRGDGDGARAELDAPPGLARRFEMPAGGIRVRPPFGADVASATLDGHAVELEDGAVAVRRLPAAVGFAYKPGLENKP